MVSSPREADDNVLEHPDRTRRLRRAGSPQGEPQPEALVVPTGSPNDLDQIRLPHVQAVIYTPSELPGWFASLADAVHTDRFLVNRTVLHGVWRDVIDGWLAAHLPVGVSEEVREAFQRDVMSLIDRCGALTGATRYVFRILTDVPNCRCGYHVDTVPPGAVGWGLLRVYCGPQTEYAHPANVSSVREFYRYLSRRERLTREAREAEQAGDPVSCLQALAEIDRLDAEPPFLCNPRAVLVVPPGSVVAFKHIDVQRHWSNHPKADAWIHRSPMAGNRRLVVNVSAG